MTDRWKQIETLFHQALGKPVEERSAFLEALCGDDSELRSQVETLLKRDNVDDSLKRPADISPGSELGPYEILSPLGRGGMGEVWRAQDAKLGREVAIKTLPSEFADDPDRLARFEREAKLLASLNHPNIAAIYGLEEHEGSRLLVLELVEGDTLADRIERGAIPVEESLELALQIAEALVAAHEKGVVHRDLKPANIKITPEGRVKVLDFGLAKVVTGGQSDVDLSDSPTRSMAATREGVILGTAGYMSPEQARGETADHRADVWAFGVVLFEMLTGRATFEGRTTSDVLAGVLAKNPPWERLPHNLHPRLLQLFERCLARDLKDRYAGISDARVDVAAVLADAGGGTVEAGDARFAIRSGIRTVLPWAAAAAVLAALLTWLLAPFPETQPGGVMRFPIPIPRGQVLTQLAVRGLDISRDGTKVAYIANNKIYLRELSEDVARPLPGTAGTDISTPVFSPDGESIAFYELRTIEDTILKRVPIAGGTPISLREGVAPLSVSWPTDDTILFVTVAGDAVLQIPADGGDDVVLLSAREGETLESPQLLPDGSLLFTSRSTGATWDGARIYIQARGSDERTLVWEGGSDARWVSTGHIIYANGSELFAGPWDLGRTETMRGVLSIVQGVQRASNSDAAQYAVSENGTMIYVPGGNAAVAPTATRRSSLVWVNPDGSETLVPIPANEFRMARISPDQRRVALVVGFPGDIYVHNLETGTGGPRTFDPEADETYPLWRSNDELLFASRLSDRLGVYSMSPEGGEATFIGNAGGALGTVPASISPDASILLAGSLVSDSESDVAVLDLGSPTGFRTLIQGNPASVDPAFAPNGQWLAAVERPTGRSGKIVLRPFPDVERNLVDISESPDDRRHPLFFDDRLLFLIRDQGIFSVDVTLEPELTIGQTTEPLVIGRYWYGVDSEDGWGGRAWDVDPEGRFLMIRFDEIGAEAEATARSDHISVVVNWFTELLERVPVD